MENGTDAQKEALIRALKDGNIVPHALPFTMHTELLDEETLAYGLSVVDRLDEIRSKKTVSAKMTDVPGHTAAIVPQLAKHGIKLLHIGVNGASAVPEVPKCFLWKIGGADVVVVYSGDYGGAYKSEFVDEVLYFDHTLDNHGAPSPEAVQKKLADIQKEYPDYSVSAGTLDEFAEAIWAVKDKLPVLTGEIGDTWIHGSAADPYKSAALRTLMRLKREWLKDGTVKALLSDKLSKDSGILTKSGTKTYWDRSALYGMRGLFYVGESDKAVNMLTAYTKERLLGCHPPYPVEAFPEGNSAQLSAESALYLRIFTEGILGYRPTGFSKFEIKPNLPSAWENFQIQGMELCGKTVDITVTNGEKYTVQFGGDTVTVPKGETYTYKF